MYQCKNFILLLKLTFFRFAFMPSADKEKKIDNIDLSKKIGKCNRHHS